jgi:NAD(P)-dependent dehydrogenase (short-subunit alcohol dehydrogenase family)
MNNVWIIGGSQGIGLAVARRFKAMGWRVTASARDKSRLEQLRVSDGFEVLPMDATEPQQVMTATAQMFTDRQSVPQSILINIGDYHPMPISEFSAELFVRLNATNYLGPAYLLEQILPLMREAGGGSVWINASLAAYRGLPRSAPYSASKAAVLNMVECLAPEAEKWGIHLGVINHGFVKTRLTDKNGFDMPLLVEPEVAAAHIVKGMQKRKFEISCPWLFSFWMKLLRCLPYSLYFILTRRMV